MILRYILSAAILFFSFAAFSQKLDEDSLINNIKQAKDDSTRIMEMYRLANYQLTHLKKDSVGLQTLNDAFKKAQKANFTQGIAQYYLTYGNYNRRKNAWANSINAYTSLLTIAKEIKNDSVRNGMLLMGNNNLGGIYNFNGDFNESLNHRLRALQLTEENFPNDYTKKGIIYINIASDYRKLKIYDKALYYLDKTHSFFDQLSDMLKMEYFYEYFQNYSSANNGKEAQEVLNKMANGLEKYNLSEFQRNDFRLVYSKCSGLYNYDIANNYTKALSFFNQQVSQAKLLNQQNEMVEGLTYVGHTQLKLNKTDSAIRSYSIAYDTAKKYQLNNLLLDVMQALGIAYYQKGNYAAAYKSLSDALKLTSTIYDTENNQQLLFTEAKFQNAKNEKEIAALNLSNAQKELTVLKRNRLLLFGGIAAASLLIILSLLYRNSHQKRSLAEKDKKLKEEEIKFLTHQQQVVSLQSMINGQETERTRIAKDLHDGLGGLFSTIKMHLSTLQHEQPVLGNNTLFSKSFEMVDTASKELRRIAHNMMPEVLIKIGLVQAVQDLANNISVGKLLAVTVQSYGMEQRLNRSTEIMLYRIIQELLNNIIKHANATQAIIQFNKMGNQLTVTVEDNGKGFNTVEKDDTIHAGLETVKSRVNYLNGNISIDSEAQVGTTVIMNFLINE